MPKTLKTKTSKIFKTKNSKICKRKNSKICKRKNPISKEEIIKLLDELVFKDVNLYIGFSEEPHKGLLWKTWLTNYPYGIRTQDNIRIIFPDFAVKTIKGLNIFIPTENVWMLQTYPKDYNLYLGDPSTKTLIKHSRYGYISKIKYPKGINNLIRGKYYISQENKADRIQPFYKIFIFNHYEDNFIVGNHPKTFKEIYIENEDITEIYGPFSSIDETLSYGQRLQQGKWLFWPYI